MPLSGRYNPARHFISEDLPEPFSPIIPQIYPLGSVKDILFSFQKNNYGFEGLCLSDNIDKLAGLNISKEIPELSQISIAVMKKYSQLK